MSDNNSDLRNKLDKLLEKLESIGKLASEKAIEPVCLVGNGPHFYWSINDKMFLEIPSGSELYLMTDRGEKEGKYYIFSPWRWNMGCIFLIPKEKVKKIGLN